MNNSESMMDLTEQSNLSITQSVCSEESSLNLNNNVDFSKIDISEMADMEQHEEQKHSEQQDKSSYLIEQTISSKMPETEDLPDISVEESSQKSVLQLEEEEEDIDDQSTLQQKTMQNGCSPPRDAVEVCDFFQNPCIELGRRLWHSTAQVQHYTKGCLWSPDGTCILVPVHLDGMHVIELPSDLYAMDELCPSERSVSDLSTAVHVKEGGTVYDCSWYPFMNSGAPETCCWLASRQHEPIHMWDAFNGDLRCTYRGYDEVDEVESAISVTFSNDGKKVMGGYKKSIKVFDTNIPGRDCFSMPVKQAVSCFALTTDNDETVTAGSWNGYINHYDLRAPKLGSLFTLGGHKGGITWLRYAGSTDQWMLFSGARKDNKILQWDMRNYTEPVREFTRTVSTNQRIYFDLSGQQELLVSGDTGGQLRVWDLRGENDDVVLPLHSDCCNGVNFHPSRPILATSSGQYHFVDVTHDEEEEKTLPHASSVEKIVDYESSLMLLWYGKRSVETK